MIVIAYAAYLILDSYKDYHRKKGYEDYMKEVAEKEANKAMQKVEYTKGKELREENLYRSTLEEIQARFSCSPDLDVAGALENVNAALEKYGLEIVIGHAPDTDTWLRVEEIKQ